MCDYGWRLSLIFILPAVCVVTCPTPWKQTTWSQASLQGKCVRHLEELWPPTREHFPFDGDRKQVSLEMRALVAGAFLPPPPPSPSYFNWIPQGFPQGVKSASNSSTFSSSRTDFLRTIFFLLSSVISPVHPHHPRPYITCMLNSHSHRYFRCCIPSMTWTLAYSGRKCW